ncbi:sulfotransferase [Coleofasciculus chthonoplastes]|uniref:sulfotransferase n=1 Tax=Coleofasciculus chthonoplastes TaxID=64178 RepID=UPI00330063E1
MDIDYNVILGCPRSGTTFLLDSLKALPQSECMAGHLLPIVIPHLINCDLSAETYQALLTGFEFSLIDFIESISEERVSAIHRWLTQSMGTTELIQALQRKRVIERIVYKEPFLSFVPEFTYKALPNCRIVHIYRDGRDCADSLIRKYDVLTDEKLTHLRTAEVPLGRKYDHRYVPWWVDQGLEAEFLAATPYVRAIWMWKEMVRRCYDFFSRPDIIASNRVLLLKYEDLARDPIHYGEAVIAHFGCSLNHQLRQKFQQARTSSISIYKRRDRAEIAAAEQVAKSELALYGYL